MTPPTDAYSWPEHERFYCVAEDGTKHAVIVRKEPPQRVRTLDGVHTVGGGHIAYFLTDGTPLYPLGQQPTEFAIYNTNETLRKI